MDSLIGGTNVSVCENVEDTLHELNRRVTKNVMLQEKVKGVEVSFTVSVGPVESQLVSVQCSSTREPMMVIWDP